MRSLLLFGTIYLFITSLAFGQLKSPFPSSVQGISIPNAHFVTHGESVLRSMAPSSGQVKELIKEGVTDILIFKNQTKDEVDKEVEMVKEISKGKIKTHHIPFKWNGFKSTKTACLQTVQSLKIIKQSVTRGGKVLFHCTVGEDRTGYLAGLLQILNGSSLEEAFQKEMCEKGYGRGNPNKPWKVVSLIRRDLTPLFLKMAEKIINGDLGSDLDESICNDLDDLEVQSHDFQCQKQSLIEN